MKENAHIGWGFIFFFLSRLFAAIGSQGAVLLVSFTGQPPGIGTVFIPGSLQMCKVLRQNPKAKSTNE